MTLVQFEPKAIKIWTTDIKKVYLGSTLVRPPFKPRTFTISWTEQSNMSSGWTYSDDAAGLTAGSWDFDDFFWYSAVLLNASGVETAKMTQSWWVFTGAMTTLGNITSWDNVMIKFPIRWIKMSKNWSVVTLSITEELNKTWYQYYAFNENWTQKDCLYLWAYKWTNSWWYLRSWSWTSSIWGISLNAAVSAANAYWWWYHEETYYARQLINAYYIMKYGNPNSQSVIGNWYVWWSSAQTTWATNSITNATWATNTGTTWRIKLFWLEDYRGNVVELLDWARFIWWTNYLSTSSTQEFSSTWIINTFDKSMPTIPWYISSIVGTNDAMFIWYSSSSWSSSTYYCDYYNRLNWHWLCAGGFWSSAQEAWVFYIYNRDNTNTHWANGTRLMYL